MLIFNTKNLQKLSSVKMVNSINPATGRLHTEYRQLGTVTGRIAVVKESNQKWH